MTIAKNADRGVSGKKLRAKRSSKAQVRRFTRSRFGTFVYMVFICVMGLFSILPLIYSISTSFKPLDELLIFPPRFFVHRPTVDNYRVLPSLFSNLSVPLSRYVFNSLFISTIATLAHVFISSMAAFVLSKSKKRWCHTAFMIIQFSLMFNAYTLAVPRYLVYSGMGIINTYWVYILPAIPSALGVFLIKQYMDSFVPDSLLEAAMIDGSGFASTYLRIVMPIIKPAWLTAILFAFQSIWSTQYQGTIFSESLKILPTVMGQITAGGIARSGSAMAVTVLLMIPPVLVYLISQSNIVETMSSSGIKG